MNVNANFKLNAARKRLVAAANHAETIRNMQRHLCEPEADAALRAAIAEARRAARTCKDVAALQDAFDRLAAATGEGTPWKPLHPHALAENFEVLVVAIAVAMALRCYLFQPFKIPTGSMQPTLYGIHTVATDTRDDWDYFPLNWLKWIVTGDWYTEVRVKAGGTVVQLPATVKPGYVSFRVAGKTYHVPSEAVVVNGRIDLSALRDVRPNGTIRPGGVLWSGIVKAGDHVFVNRIAWNFRRPRRGDVMVFSTTGINGLPQGTHYIKRMSGLPGETISISPPQLVVDGMPVESPPTMARIARREQLSPDVPAYAGYLLIRTNAYIIAEAPTPLCTPLDKVHLGPDEYYALGDNTANSRDSRYWGPVPERKLLGPAAFIYWPLTRIRAIE